jgi:hypothetical protein
MIFISSRTHKLVVQYSVIYWPYELPISVQTCTQPRSELPIVGAGRGEVPGPISGRRRCICSSYHLQTMHTTDHCESGGARRWRQPTSSLPWRMQRAPCRAHLPMWLVSVRVVAGAHLVAHGSLLSADNGHYQPLIAAAEAPST